MSSDKRTPTNEEKQDALANIAKRLPANSVRYAALLVGLTAIIGQSNVPPEAQTMVAGLGALGINLLANLIDRVALNPEAISDDMIKHVEEALHSSNILSEQQLIKALRQVTQHNASNEQAERIISLLESQFSPPIDRVDWIQENLRKSRARCIERWQAVGLRRDEAVNFTDNPTTEHLENHFYPTIGQPIRLLVAELGTGKSLIAERMFQKFASEYLNDLDAPIPIYLKSDYSGSLEAAILENVPAALNFKTSGANVIIDGLDEVGTNSAFQILKEARILANTWNRVTVTLTSRPIRDLGDSEETVKVPLLSEEEAVNLILLVAGQNFNEKSFKYNNPPAIREAVQRPLFAILFGIYRREHYGQPNSVSELISGLVTKALSNLGDRIDRAREILEKLAVYSVNRSNSLVPINEITSYGEIAPLVNSGLIIQRDDLIGFPLIILTHWFAAQSLARENQSVEVLLSNHDTLYNWYYPLVILVGNYSHEQVTRVITLVVEQHPAFISEIVEKSLSRWYRGRESALPPLADCKHQVLETMRSWVAGLGQLAAYIAPIGQDGKLVAVDFGSSDSEISWEWHNQDTISPLLQNKETFRSSKITSQSAWAWQLTLSELQTNLTHVMESRLLPINSEILLREQLWKTAFLLTDTKRVIGTKAIPIDAIEQKLEEIEYYLSIAPSYTIRTHGHDYNFDRSSVSRLREEITRLKNHGYSEVESPLPGPDLISETGEKIFFPYSSEQVLKRVRATFEGAVEVYQSLVDTWFPNLKLRLNTAATLPATVRVNVYKFDPYQTFELGISWFFDPLPANLHTLVEVTLGTDRITDEEWTPTFAKLCQLRSGAANWMHSTLHNGYFHVFGLTPVTDLAYEWLWSDLKEVSWLKKDFPRSYDW